MPSIHHSHLREHLDTVKNGVFAPVYLVYGEEMLYKRALERLLAALLPGEAGHLNYDPLDGTDAQVAEALERVNTFSLLAGTKVIGLLDSTVFYSRVDPADFLKKSRTAHQRGDFKRAAVHLLTLLSRKDFALEDIDADNRLKTLGSAAPETGEDRWLDEVIDYCRENGLGVPPRSDPAKLLQLGVEKGFPKNNHLVITTDRIDRRQGLYKTLEAHGVVIDCSVPAGDSRANKLAQETVLMEQAQSVMSAAGKKIDPAAFRAIVEMTGFDLRTFCSNLEKLVSYVGSKENISADDVNRVLKRTRVDPLYEFTNAVTDRNLPTALFYLDSLLTGGVIDHPLQLLAAMVNQIRRLLIFRAFLESSQGRAWQPGCNYGQFQSQVMPAIKEFDQVLAGQIEGWKTELEGSAEEGQKVTGSAKPKKKAPAWGADLAMAGAGKSPYPIYLMLQKSGGFTKKRIIEIMAHLQQADRRLKSAASSPKTVLEEAVMFFCR